MPKKSSMLECLNDALGFEINDINKAPEGLSGRLLRELLDILVKYGTVDERGHEKIYFAHPKFSLCYYFATDDCIQKNPSFGVNIHNPCLSRFSTCYSFYLDNGIYVSWDANGASVKDVWQIVRSFDTYVVKKGLKRDSIVSQTRYPLLFNHGESDDDPAQKLIDRNLKIYYDFNGIKLCRFKTLDFVEKKSFLTKVPDELSGFEPLELSAAPKGVIPEILRDVWVLACRMGEFLKDDKTTHDTLVFTCDHLEIFARNSSISWINDLSICSNQNKTPDSSNTFTKFKLKNGLKVSWDDYFSPLDLRVVLNDVRRKICLAKFDENGRLIEHVPIDMSKGIPIFFDRSLETRNYMLDISKQARSFAQ